MSTERILVHKSIIDKFAASFKVAVEEMFGPDSPAPVLINAAGVEKNKKLINSAVSSGAKILSGEEHLTAKEKTQTRLRPIVVQDVTKDMDLFYAESFGPSVSLVNFETEQEAIDIANDTEYGLSGAVFTEDLRTGLRIAKRIESGAV